MAFRSFNSYHYESQGNVDDNDDEAMHLLSQKPAGSKKKRFQDYSFFQQDIPSPPSTQSLYISQMGMEKDDLDHNDNLQFDEAPRKPFSYSESYEADNPYLIDEHQNSDTGNDFYETHKLSSTRKKLQFTESDKMYEEIHTQSTPINRGAGARDLDRQSGYFQGQNLLHEKRNTSYYDTPNAMAVEVQDKMGNGATVQLRSTREIPEPYRKIFSFPYFNVVQSKVMDDVVYTDKPIVVCAPTGSGKTALFELAIVRMLIQGKNKPDFSYKIVYMAPMKALCSERLQDWSNKFGSLGLKCTEVTGDSDLDDFHELQSTHIVLTTPEKWDSMTRKWRDYKSLVQLIRLFLIDEAHVIADEARGATMEAVVSRMKTVQGSILEETENRTESFRPSIRFIAVSATIPNVEDLAEWLNTGTCETACYSLGEEYRPVHLRKVVLGYNCQDNQSDFRFDLSLNYKLSGIIQTYSDCKPTIVFCSTRKGTSQAANTLVKDARFIFGQEHRQKLLKYANMLRDSKLRDIVTYGVGYHHAGMDSSDRKTIEGMFAKGELPVLFCTSTLAMGVNLPAHLVIVKSTMHYAVGMYEEYPESQVLQMIGRAGRPQFDTDATAVIMTKNSTKSKYQALVSGTQLMESSLHGHLTEHINAEIVLGTITSTSVALEWLQSTFLYQRMQKNPTYYGVSSRHGDDDIEKKLEVICLEAIHSLQSLDLIDARQDNILRSTGLKNPRPSGLQVPGDEETCKFFEDRWLTWLQMKEPFETGKLMARYCIAFATMKSFLALTGKESLEELIILLSKSKEFEDITLRNNEKRALNTLNKDKHRPTIRFPMKSRIKTTDQKISCLIQAALGCLPITEFSLSQDITKIFRAAQRVTRCLMEFCLLKGYFYAGLNATLLCKCIRARLWENTKFVSRQIEKIGPTMSSALVNAGLTSFAKIEEANPREIELIVNRHPPFGSQIKDLISSLPKYSMQIMQDGIKMNTASLFLKVLMTNHEKRKEHLKQRRQIFQHCCTLIVADSTGNLILRNKLMDSAFMSTGEWTRNITIHRTAKPQYIYFHLISLDYVGVDVEYTFTPEFSGTSQASYHPQQSSIGNVSNLSSSEESQRKSHRTCGHKCLNKAWCGHECCRLSVQSDVAETVAGTERKSVKKKTSQPTSQKKQREPHRTEKTSTPKGKSGLENFYNQLHSKTDALVKTPAKRMKINMTFTTENPEPTSNQKLKLTLEENFGYTPRKLNFVADFKEAETSKRQSLAAKATPERNSLTPRLGASLGQVDDFCMLRGETPMQRSWTANLDDPNDIFGDDDGFEESYDFREGEDTDKRLVRNHDVLHDNKEYNDAMMVEDTLLGGYDSCGKSKYQLKWSGGQKVEPSNSTKLVGQQFPKFMSGSAKTYSTIIPEFNSDEDSMFDELITEEERSGLTFSKRISKPLKRRPSNLSPIFPMEKSLLSDESDISDLETVTLDAIATFSANRDMTKKDKHRLDISVPNVNYKIKDQVNATQAAVAVGAQDVSKRRFLYNTHSSTTTCHTTLSHCSKSRKIHTAKVEKENDASQAITAPKTSKLGQAFVSAKQFMAATPKPDVKVPTSFSDGKYNFYTRAQEYCIASEDKGLESHNFSCHNANAVNYKALNAHPAQKLPVRISKEYDGDVFPTVHDKNIVEREEFFGSKHGDVALYDSDSSPIYLKINFGINNEVKESRAKNPDCFTGTGCVDDNPFDFGDVFS